MCIVRIIQVRQHTVLLALKIIVWPGYSDRFKINYDISLRGILWQWKLWFVDKGRTNFSTQALELSFFAKAHTRRIQQHMFLIEIILPEDQPIFSLLNSCDANCSSETYLTRVTKKLNVIIYQKLYQQQQQPQKL